MECSFYFFAYLDVDKIDGWIYFWSVYFDILRKLATIIGPFLRNKQQKLETEIFSL